MTSDQIHDLAVQLLGKSAGTLDAEQANVLRNIQQHSPISRDAADVADEQSSFGQRLADRVAAIGGSWGFIISFLVLLLAWMVLNTDVLGHWGLAFDAYPYIFLNLMLSMIAALQAPVIMMSQNRQASKDRVGASLDYEVNLRAELEIFRLHEKLDRSVSDRLDQLCRQQAELTALVRRCLSSREGAP